MYPDTPWDWNLIYAYYRPKQLPNVGKQVFVNPGPNSDVTGRVIGLVGRPQCVYVGHHMELHPKAFAEGWGGADGAFGVFLFVFSRLNEE